MELTLFLAATSGHRNGNSRLSLRFFVSNQSLAFSLAWRQAADAICRSIVALARRPFGAGTWTVAVNIHGWGVFARGLGGWRRIGVLILRACRGRICSSFRRTGILKGLAFGRRRLGGQARTAQGQKQA
jgi:hypothetical protein